MCANCEAKNTKTCQLYRMKTNKPNAFCLVIGEIYVHLQQFRVAERCGYSLSLKSERIGKAK